MDQYFGDPNENFVHLRCFNHAQREAAARCPACGRFFCRECVSEHRNQLLCAACIADKGARAQGQQKRSFGPLRAALRMALGMLVLWVSFFIMGKALLSVPSTFHDRESLVVEESEESERP